MQQCYDVNTYTRITKKALKKLKKDAMLTPYHRPKVSKSSVLPTVHWIHAVNGCPDRHRCPLRTLVEKLQLSKTFINNAHAGAHSFHFEQAWCRSVQRWQSYQPDEERMQTDRQMAFLLYIVVP